MSYPYLPVSPCCTDVVLNTPCGCSSTIPNGSCNDNPCGTNITLASDIIYNGPALTCITAEPCNTLNVVLQKIDEIICNLLSQISTLNTQVININSELLTINSDIDNIYNTLDYCCVTTTTTTRRPCEQFSLNNTGETPVAIIITDCTTQVESAIVLLPGSTNICVLTDSPLTVPGNVIVTPNGPCSPLTTTTTSSSTTSTSSSTTTTTTTAHACECLTFYNPDTTSHEITYRDCDGSYSRLIEIFPNETIQYCGSEGEATNPIVTITIGANCVEDSCPTTTSTTTICNNPNLAINGTFNTNINGWTDSTPPDWQWSALHGGSAHYIGRDEYAILSQNILTPGTTYDITFDLWCSNPTNTVKVLAGTTAYNVTGISVPTSVSLIMTCAGTTLFGFQGFDALAAPFDTIYIKNVNVSVHCSQFTTTTTTTHL